MTKIVAKTPSSTEPIDGVAILQKQADDATQKGYIGTTPDKTPNENYTLAGVIAGKPTPENSR